MILTRNMFIYFSYFDIDQGHWCIVQTEARSEMGYRFSGSGLKRGMIIYFGLK